MAFIAISLQVFWQKIYKNIWKAKFAKNIEKSSPQKP